MKFNLKNELPNILIVLWPSMYLLSIWNALPDVVPTHWDYRGVADDFGSKWTLWFLALGLPVGTYLSFFILPKIDPKGKLHLMGAKYPKMKLILTTLFSVLAIYIIYSTQNNELDRQLGIVFISILFIVLGNFMPSIKPNYFLGIRVPWTLHNEYNWRKTHQFAGKLWMVSGLVMLFVALFSSEEGWKNTFFPIIIAISLIPTVYSYILFRRGNDGTDEVGR